MRRQTPKDHELRDKVIFMLNNRKHDCSLSKIASDTQLGERWIRSVLKNDNDPSAGRLTILYKYLAKVDSLNLS